MASASNHQVYHQIQKVKCYRQSGLVYIYVISVALSYKHILYIKAAYTNYLAGSLNIYTGKTPVPDSGTLFAHLFANEKPYYNNGLFSNESIDPTSIGL